MAKLFNLARMTTTTTGTGTITLGAAVSGYLSFAGAGVANSDVIDYAIKDGNSSEIGIGTYSSSGPTLTRTVTKSTNSNSPINLSGAAEVFITPRAETLNGAAQLSNLATVATTGAYSDLSGKPGLASTAEAQAGTDTAKTMTPARTAEAIAALGGSGWEQIGSTQTLGSNTSYVEQSWTAGTYRQVMCLAAIKCTSNVASCRFALRNSSTEILYLSSSQALSTGSFAPFEAVSTIAVGVCQLIRISPTSSSVYDCVASTSATTPDRMRISPPSASLAAGSVFMFFGLR
jgi:hypothetical protein